MIDILDDIKNEYAIQLIYDYINIINENIRLEKDKSKIIELQKIKESLKLKLKEIYTGNDKVAFEIIKNYSSIIKIYYEKRKK